MIRPIVIFAPAIDAFGGVERLIVDLSRHLYANGLAHYVVCFSHRANLTAYADWPLEVIVLKAPRSSMAEAWALAKHVREADVQAPLVFDLKGAFYAGLASLSGFHLHLTDPPSLLPTDVSKFASSVGFGEISPLLRCRSKAVHLINRHGARRAASLIAMTNVIADELEALYGRRANVINPGIRPPPAPPRHPPSGGGTIRFLSVSRLEASKRIDWIMCALKALKADWALDVVGDGSEAEHLRRLAAELKIGDRVVFHGRLSDAALNAQFALSTLR